MVPADVVHRGRAYCDRVDMSADDLYALLQKRGEALTTAAPPAGRFIEAYERLAADGSDIVSVHVTAEHSAICDVARQAAKAVARRSRIEVVDSRWVTMGLGFLALDAAEAAARGATVNDVVSVIRNVAPRVCGFGTFESVRHLAAGGRINPVLGKVGTTLGIKLLLTMREGRIRPSGVARTYSRAVDRVVALMEAQCPLDEWSVVYSTDRVQAEAVADRLSSVCKPGRVPVTRLGPALGVHGGPGAIIVVAKKRAP